MEANTELSYSALFENFKTKLKDICTHKELIFSKLGDNEKSIIVALKQYFDLELTPAEKKHKNKQLFPLTIAKDIKFEELHELLPKYVESAKKDYIVWSSKLAPMLNMLFLDDDYGAKKRMEAYARDSNKSMEETDVRTSSLTGVGSTENVNSISNQLEQFRNETSEIIEKLSNEVKEAKNSCTAVTELYNTQQVVLQQKTQELEQAQQVLETTRNELNATKSELVELTRNNETLQQELEKSRLNLSFKNTNPWAAIDPKKKEEHKAQAKAWLGEDRFGVVDTLCQLVEKIYQDGEQNKKIHTLYRINKIIFTLCSDKSASVKQNIENTITTLTQKKNDQFLLDALSKLPLSTTSVDSFMERKEWSNKEFNAFRQLYYFNYYLPSYEHGYNYFNEKYQATKAANTKPQEKQQQQVTEETDAKIFIEYN